MDLEVESDSNSSKAGSQEFKQTESAVDMQVAYLQGPNLEEKSRQDGEEVEDSCCKKKKPICKAKKKPRCGKPKPRCAKRKPKKKKACPKPKARCPKPKKKPRCPRPKKAKKCRP